MAWLWDSWEEYADGVHPVAVDRSGIIRMSHQDSWFETESSMCEAVWKLEEKVEALRQLGFTGSSHDKPPQDSSIIAKAEHLVWEAIFEAETLLAYHKRLATSDAAYGFLHQHDLLSHWGRYAQTGRIAGEIHQLMFDIHELLQGYQGFTQTDQRFLVDDLDLPDSLEADFRLARNLFSVGFDELGLLMAGRGLEGVLRKIAEVRKVSLVAKGKSGPASEADLYDLIETMSQLRWKTNGTRLISPDTKALLHYLRALRNGGAHAARGKASAVSPREQAAIVAETANRVWEDVSTTRARLDPPAVQKTWA